MLNERGSLFFKGVVPGRSTTPHSVTMHLAVYRQHKLDRMGFKQQIRMQSWASRKRDIDPGKVGEKGTYDQNVIYEVLKGLIKRGEECSFFSEAHI